MSVEELAAYRAFVAWLVLEYGSAYVPIFDRVERDYAEALRGDPLLRARKVLETVSRPLEATGKAPLLLPSA